MGMDWFLSSLCMSLGCSYLAGREQENMCESSVVPVAFDNLLPLRAVCHDLRTIFTDQLVLDSTAFLHDSRTNDSQRSRVARRVAAFGAAASSALPAICSLTLNGIMEWSSVSLHRFGESLVILIPYLRGMLSNEQVAARMRAVRLLGMLQVSTSLIIPCLAAAIEDDNFRVREMAVIALGSLTADAARPVTLLTTALADISPDVREAAAGAICKIGGVTSGEALALVNAALEDESGDVRRAATSSLCKLEFSIVEVTVVPELLRALQRGKPRSRNRAVAILGQLGCVAAPVVPCLAQAIEQDCPEFSRVAAQALCDMGRAAAAAVPRLTRALTDARSWVRRQAALVLASVGEEGGAAARALVLLALNDTEIQVRTTAKEALAGVAAGVPELKGVLERRYEMWEEWGSQEDLEQLLEDLNRRQPHPRGRRQRARC